MSKVVGKRNARNDEGPSNKEEEILMKTKRISPPPETLNGGDDMSEEQKFKFAKKCLERLDQVFQEANQYIAELGDPDVEGCSINITDPSGFKMRLHRRSKKEVK
jgi:hypothetical protein